MYNLIDEYKQAVDEGKLTQTAAYQLSFLSSDEQNKALEYLPKLNEKTATELVKLSKENSFNNINTIFEKPQKQSKISIKKYAKQVLNSESLASLDDILKEALDMYLKAHPNKRK